MKTAAQLIVKKIEEVLEKLSSKGPQKSNEPHLGTSPDEVNPEAKPKRRKK